MTDKQENETVSVGELKQNLAAILNDAAVQGRVVYITNHGRPYAAVVPWAVAEAEERRRAADSGPDH